MKGAGVDWEGNQQGLWCCPRSAGKDLAGHAWRLVIDDKLASLLFLGNVGVDLEMAV